MRRVGDPLVCFGTGVGVWQAWEAMLFVPLLASAIVSSDYGSCKVGVGCR